tara:strand:+ start:243 stop:416 length:174 start_codon:yes stop_codon:yes gene_type:complete
MVETNFDANSASEGGEFRAPSNGGEDFDEGANPETGDASRNPNSEARRTFSIPSDSP